MSAWASGGKVGNQPVTFSPRCLSGHEQEKTTGWLWFPCVGDDDVGKIFNVLDRNSFSGTSFLNKGVLTRDSGYPVFKLFQLRLCVCLACCKGAGVCVSFLTVATILLTAAADSSSPLGCSTIVTPRYLSWTVMPSRRVSLVSVQFSGSSADERHAPVTLLLDNNPGALYFEAGYEILCQTCASTAFSQSAWRKVDSAALDRPLPYYVCVYWPHAFGFLHLFGLLYCSFS